MDSVLAEEYEGSRLQGRVLLDPSSPGGAVVTQPTAQDGRRGGAGGATAHALRAAFLPDGYPDSVSSDYLAYQVWDSIQGLSSYVRGMLSSQAMLAGLGVGSQEATPLGAVFQWFVKDMAGMAGGVLLASSQGAGFDCYAKQWRLFADVVNDVGMALELASPLLPGAFLLLACLGSLARAATGVAGGATRMALTSHFAQQRNAADIAAKEGSQETAVTLVGMALGMLLIRAAAGCQPLVWAAFAALTALHVWANVRAMRCLRVASLNRPRLELLLRHYLCMGEALTPEQLAARESLVPPPLLRLLRRLGLGRPGGGVGVEVAVAPRWASLSAAWQRHLAACLREESGSSRRYLAAAAPTQERQQGPLARLAAGAAPDAVVLLRRDATAADVLEAYCAALLLAWNARLRRGGREAGPWPAPAQLALADAKGWVAGAAAAAAPPAAPGSSASGDGGAGTCAGGSAAPNGSSFCAALASAGWALQRVALLQGPWRLAWGTELHRAE